MSMATAVARSRLLMGPAMEMMPASLLGFFRLKGSKGVGFPQPKTKLVPEILEKMIRLRGRSTVPIGSMWAKGLRVSLPAARGVGSPNLSAAKACANS
ncbi:MAG: hypothetical protein UW80_C0025G0010 [Microgenomates group bacterium GW2011_GWC1_44_9]|nr:MAG: hypothetical protein UW80_C0025G0010 [Microgenomates group bacterium GW2011_GWC1_44_9]